MSKTELWRLIDSCSGALGGGKGHISKLKLKGVCQIFSVVLSKSCFPVKLEAGRAKNLWNLLQLEIASMVSITNIFLLFLLFRSFSGVDWGFPYEITASNEYCFEDSLGLSIFVLPIQIFLTQRHQYFFCDSVKLYPPPAPQVYRTSYELILLSMHLCALMVKKVDC